MTGKPDLNRPAFDAAEKRLAAQGHFVINPHRISELFGSAAELSASFLEYYRLLSIYGEDAFNNSEMCLMAKYRTRVARAVMDADLAAVRSCDAIYLLRGWESSRGAKKELAEALAHGLTVMQEGGEE
jgi:hypothetical protein